MPFTDTCPIWGELCDAGSVQRIDGDIVVEDSPRAGGAYVITDEARSELDQASPEEKARLTSWIVDQRVRGETWPTVTKQIVMSARDKRPLPVYERAHRLLQYMANITETVGAPVYVGADSVQAYAWSDSINKGEIEYLLSYLEKSGFIQTRGAGRDALEGRVTVDGYREIEEQATNPDSSQAFVAMWFHDSMDRAYEDGIRPGIEDAGYNALRVDRTEHINKIDDEIIAGIRRSRFLVADFTQGDDGARGGVYYEAGFAAGLGIPVIYTCWKRGKDDLAFDTRQYNHILWDTPDELQTALRNRIVAVVGEGPGVAV